MAKTNKINICKDCAKHIIKTSPPERPSKRCPKIVRVEHLESTLGMTLSVISCKDFKKKGK